MPVCENDEGSVAMRVKGSGDAYGERLWLFYIFWINKSG